MARMRASHKRAQVWIELRTEDPEASSALAVARERLAAGHGLSHLRRLRVFDLDGPLPGRRALEELLRRSTQFYNPAKERCRVRLKAEEPPPVGADEIAVLVVERGGERREAAERWWFHESGQRVEVREGVAWALRFGPEADPERDAGELITLRDRGHGLLCNPHSQEGLVAAGEIPLPWLPAEPPRKPPEETGGQP